MDDYNVVRKEFKKIISKMNYSDIKSDVGYYFDKNYIETKIKEMFEKEDISIDFTAIYKIAHIIFQDNKIIISFYLQDGSWFYDITSMKICVNGIDVTHADGKWYPYIINEMIPKINNIIIGIYDYFNREAESKKNKEDLKIAKCNEIF